MSKPDAHVITGATFLYDPNLEQCEMRKSFFINEFNGKVLKVMGSDYILRARILDVKVSSSMAEMKNIFFLLI